MTGRTTCRTFPTAFKLAAIQAPQSREAVLPLARERGVSRKFCMIGARRGTYMGQRGLNRKRGPNTRSSQAPPVGQPAAKGSGGELANARAKIAELERKIGQQAVDIDFFTKPCAPWTRPIGKAQSYPRHGSHRNDDFI